MANADDKLAPGTVFADFQVVSVLGEGGFGAVYRAVHLRSGREVALKILRTEVATHPEVVHRFLREAEAVASLRHPNIVEAVAMGHHDNHPYLAMELLLGEPLTALMLREGALPLERALAILVPVMSAVRSVHEQGIVHRDLKPDNIFITYTAGYTVHPKVLDFGFVKFDDSHTRITRNDTTIGTPNFMAPEQLHSPTMVDARADQWALGVLLYYLLTNRKPFAADTLVGTLKNVLHEEPHPLHLLRPDLPPEVCAVVHRSLSKCVDDRFPSVHAMASALMPYTSDETALVYTSEFCAEHVWDNLDERTEFHPVLAHDGEEGFASGPSPQGAHVSEASFAPRELTPTVRDAPYVLGPAPHSLQPVVHAQDPNATTSLLAPAWLPIVVATAVAAALVAGALHFAQRPEVPHAAGSPVLPARAHDAAVDASGRGAQP
jgi:serine/threonine protein kinase